MLYNITVDLFAKRLIILRRYRCPNDVNLRNVPPFQGGTSLLFIVSA